ncbi:hypothetical protein, partial [Streptomyces sp. XY332]|uniref:hypothetical protein n=1 Tax=Streptomyces sp. XY332 TaxID=1415561 RepID=UPI001F21DA6C
MNISRTADGRDSSSSVPILIFSSPRMPFGKSGEWSGSRKSPDRVGIAGKGKRESEDPGKQAGLTLIESETQER